jgi:lipopolysaccharide/colanic/teichoic acid biosynthesis glycosyltransferase
MVIAALLVKLDSDGPVFFKQERMGKGFRPFFIYKFRTMAYDAEGRGRRFTVANDPRITRVGRLLRKTKIDELPQLINVLKGEMSLVGPRPEVREYVELFRQDYEEILKSASGNHGPGLLKISARGRTSRTLPGSYRGIRNKDIAGQDQVS